MQYAALWIAGLAATTLLLGLALALLIWRQRTRTTRLPKQWALTPRPVFSADERRVFRLLREALPHHVVLSKLPLVRFCQPTETREIRYWYELLGGAHVTFAVCSPNGRVLAAIDLDDERGLSTRALQIKSAVLDACRVRYLRIGMDHLPSLAELQLLVPTSSQSSPRGPQAAPGPARSSREETFGSDWGQFSQPLPLWQDASLFGDLDNQAASRRARGEDEGADAVAGVVVERPASRLADARR